MKADLQTYEALRNSANRRTFLKRSLTSTGLRWRSPRRHRQRRPVERHFCGRHPLPPQSETRHSSLHGGRAIAFGIVRLQTGTRAVERPRDARLFHPRPATRPAPRLRAESDGAAIWLQPAREKRHDDQRSVSAHCDCRGRNRGGALNVHRADQPRSGAHFHEHRLHHSGPTQHGRVDPLWPRQRFAKPPRLRRSYQRGRRAGSADLLEAVE